MGDSYHMHLILLAVPEPGRSSAESSGSDKERIDAQGGFLRRRGLCVDGPMTPRSCNPYSPDQVTPLPGSPHHFRRLPERPMVA
jgi:hypothetical protein